MNVFCSQLGARQNYAVPRYLSTQQELSLLATDFWNPLGGRFVCEAPWLPNVIKGAQSRYRPDIPSNKVRTCLSVAYDLASLPKLGTAGGERFARASVKFGQFVAKCAGRVEHDCIFAFGGATLEGLVAEKGLRNRSVIGQYDTAQELEETIEAETHRYKSLNQGIIKLPSWYYERLREEWRLADRIIVNSTWTRDSLTRSGVPVDKITVIPLTIDPFPANYLLVPRQRLDRNLRVLWLGRLCLGKGLMYALEAARLVRHLPIEFTFTGGSWLDQGVIEWPDNCKLQAPVPRTKVSEIFSANDVFLFPTLSDGFGIVQLEAICRGLPVIATPCCGDVVEDGVSGFIVPSRDAQSIVNALVQLLVPERLEAMSAAAHLRAGEFSPERILPQYRHTLTTTTIQPALFDVAR